ncbi:MAG TPA: hypothetical protein VGH96_00175 [Streptosporangiaceae bacterium]|jgi:hypothetical protein
MPTTVWPSEAMNSFGAYVASAATVSVPADLMLAGTWAAIELTDACGVADGVGVPDPVPLLLHAAANRPTDRNTAVAAESLV